MAPKNHTPLSSSLNIRIIPFMKLQGIFGLISLLVVLISLYFIFSHGFNFGVDFKGGVKLVYQFKKGVGDGKIREALDSLNLGDIQIVRFGQEVENSFLIKAKFEKERDITKEITHQLKERLQDSEIVLLSEESVGPKVGAELRQRGVFAVILTWVLILIYIGIRFDIFFAPGAVIALLHDIIVPLGFFAVLGKEINLPILAALLTIIGYSINDTIVIYDRIRENLKKLSSQLSLTDLIDRSLSETLSRTIVTSLTVFFAVVILFILGGAVLHDFSFCMIIGVIAGTYSTIFIASPIYLLCNKIFPHHGRLRRIIR